MILFAFFIGLILVVAAVRNSQGALFSALGTDVPGFVIWAAAILALGSIGFIPELKPVSRGLLALVIVVIVLNNYQKIATGLSAVSQADAGVSPASSTSSQNTPGAAAVNNAVSAIVQSSGASSSASNAFGSISNIAGFSGG